MKLRFCVPMTDPLIKRAIEAWGGRVKVPCVEFDVELDERHGHTVEGIKEYMASTFKAEFIEENPVGEPVITLAK